MLDFKAQVMPNIFHTLKNENWNIVSNLNVSQNTLTYSYSLSSPLPDIFFSYILSFTNCLKCAFIFANSIHSNSLKFCHFN